jgi:hypothetical protein
VSYSSSSTFAASTKQAQLLEIVELLGFRPNRDGLTLPSRVASYYWTDSDYRSYSGISLDVYRSKSGALKVETRTSIARSYYDLMHQNKTIKLLRDLFGGSFKTDAGKNRYHRPMSGPPIPAASGCYLARWTFHNALGPTHIYLGARAFNGNNRATPSGLDYLDRLNPWILSNNMLLPYLIGIWEEYFKSTFVAVLRYSKDRQLVLKKARLHHEQLERIAVGEETIEGALAGSLSFQRPSSIADHFKTLDPGLDIEGTLRKPYRRRRVSLFDSIERVVEQRHAFVHSGNIDTSLVEAAIKEIIKDLEVAVDRIYLRIHTKYGWIANTDY